MNRTVNYDQLVRRLQQLTADVPYEIANLSNASALLWQALPEINWAGFYKMMDGQLVLYPFQGKTACVRIQVGKGVCGTAVAEDATQLIPDVHQFPGHIACDSASNSEIVLPLIKDGRLLGVMDIDSPRFARCNGADANGLNRLCDVLTHAVDWSQGLL